MMSKLKEFFFTSFISMVIFGFSAWMVQAQPKPPIKIGSTLALTGPLSATGIVHKIVGEIAIEEINRKGGLLGRKIEWVLKDDQSKADVARTLYEQLITSDKVDLLMGPYATGAILSAMGVAQRYDKILIHHTFGIPNQAKYDKQFSTWSLGPHPDKTVPVTVFDALATVQNPPKTIAIVTSKFPSIYFMSVGAREVAKAKNLKEVLYLEWDFGNKDFGTIAARVKDAKPDMVWIGDIGTEGIQLLEAMRKIDYSPRIHTHIYPTPGLMAQSPEADGAIAISLFQEHPPFTANFGAADFVRIYHEKAQAAGLPYPLVDVQAATSYSAWQVLEAAVKATKSFDDATLAKWLKTNKVDTVSGKLRWDGEFNYGDDLMKIAQVQNRRWVMVYPKNLAAPGVKLQVK
ncbi:MAG: amino acid ABC transporter substrate-binding protein [Polynucleobacter sp.]|jgi:branched-chain amino acid transport system substrate-binding protein|nr:amino acid ABC transporter substrate-binding protein [Polynucleobacter sp.]